MVLDALELLEPLELLVELDASLSSSLAYLMILLSEPDALSSE